MPVSLRNEAGELEAKYNVAGTLQLVIRPSLSGVLMMSTMWGLVPYWAKDAKSGVRPVDAKNDTATKTLRNNGEQQCPCDSPTT